MRRATFLLLIFFLFSTIVFGINSVLELQRFPDPIFVRTAMEDLIHNKWTFQFDENNVGLKEHWFEKDRFDENITLPFPWNSRLSGIGTGDYIEIGWYLTKFYIDKKTGILLNFGAVNYSTMVWINGKYVGKHSGGYLPFYFDISNFINKGMNSLVVRVFVPRDFRKNPHGKQMSNPPDPWSSVSFSRTCGIWQKVWLEFYDKTYIKSVNIHLTNSGKVNFSLNIFNESDVKNIEIKVYDPLAKIVHDSISKAISFSFNIKRPKLWDVDHPDLYLVEISIKDNEEVLDKVYTYFGFRTVQVKNRFVFVNNKPVFLKMVLDQGYWPEGYYVPRSKEDFKSDLEYAKNLGFNGIRMHQKIENPQFLFWADVLGMYIWEEPPSFSVYTKESAERFENTLLRMIHRDMNHPSIITWGIFNEDWGIWNLDKSSELHKYDESLYEVVKVCDPTRLVVDNSGWHHVKTDLADVHLYTSSYSEWINTLLDLSKLRAGDNISFHSSNVSHKLFASNYEYKDQPVIISEFGEGWGNSRVSNYIWQVDYLRKYNNIAGFVFVELYDIENELAGLYTYNRSPKFNTNEESRVKMINAEDTVVFDVNFKMITYFGGKSKVIPVALSHMSAKNLSPCELKWSITNINTSSSGNKKETIEYGVFKLEKVPYGIYKFFNIKFKLSPGSYVLRVAIIHNGSLVGYNWMPMYILF